MSSIHPSMELAILAADLVHKLTAPQYAESKLIIEVAKRLALQWDAIMDELQHELLAATPENTTCH